MISLFLLRIWFLEGKDDAGVDAGAATPGAAPAAATVEITSHFGRFWSRGSIYNLGNDREFLLHSGRRPCENKDDAADTGTPHPLSIAGPYGDSVPIPGVRT